MLWGNEINKEVYLIEVNGNRPLKHEAVPSKLNYWGEEQINPFTEDGICVK